MAKKRNPVNPTKDVLLSRMRKLPEDPDGYTVFEVADILERSYTTARKVILRGLQEGWCVRVGEKYIRSLINPEKYGMQSAFKFVEKIKDGK